MTPPLRIAKEVADALARGSAVVALETTLVSHGFPPVEGLEIGLECERRVRAAGAVPATVGIVDGKICVGLDENVLARFDESPDARKVGPRDIAPCLVQGGLGATTVGGTLAVARLAGIRFMGTGGLGGVHRGWTEHPDVSADLGELARTQALVVAAGAKSILDVPATAEALETLGVPILGWRTDEIPLFYRAGGGPPVSARVEAPAEAAAIASAHWTLGRGGVVVARPPERSLNVEGLIAEGVREAERRGIRGQGVTPFLLAHLHDASGGETIRANKELVAANAGLAAEIAVAASGGA